MWNFCTNFDKKKVKVHLPAFSFSVNCISQSQRWLSCHHVASVCNFMMKNFHIITIFIHWGRLWDAAESWRKSSEVLFRSELSRNFSSAESAQFYWQYCLKANAVTSTHTRVLHAKRHHVLFHWCHWFQGDKCGFTCLEKESSMSPVSSDPCWPADPWPCGCRSSNEYWTQTNMHISTFCCVFMCGTNNVYVFVWVYLHPHVGQDDAAGHPALGGGAAKPLEVLVHAVLPERRLDRSRCPPGHKRAPVLPLQHLHLSGSTITHRQPISAQRTERLDFGKSITWQKTGPM